jgi:hypothetical protein
VLENGLDIRLLMQEIAVSRIAAFGWLDVIVSALALFAFLLYERRQKVVRYAWLAVLGTLIVGVSLGLPLYLYLRENSMNVA